MTAGRELDAWIAEKVMGNPPPVVPPGVWPQELHSWQDRLPLYSTDIAAAWEVVEKLKSLGFKVGVDEEGSDLAACVVAKSERGIVHVIASETAATAPLAICLAALRACGVEI